MRNGNDSLAISESAVRTALDALTGALPLLPHTNALRSLLLVDEILDRPDFPHVERARELAVYHILTAVISENLIYRRQILLLNIPHETMSVEDVRSDIITDGQQGSPDLLVWSLLYHCYVCVEFNITLADFSRLINVVERSGRRYRKQAVQKLTHEITQREWAARAAYHRRRLLLHVPLLTPAAFSGRDSELQQVVSILSSTPAHLVVSGPPGIGKTSFTRAALRAVIDSEQSMKIDEIVWINAPQTIDDVYRSIERHIRVGDERDVRSYFLIYNVVIVIDDMAAIVEEVANDIDDLLVFLSHCSVILISDASLTVKDATAHIILKGLSFEAASQLIHALSPAVQDQDHIFSQDYARELYEFVGGNPAGIKLGMQYSMRGDYDVARADILHTLFARAYSRLNPRLKDGLIAFAMCPPDGLPAGELNRFLPSVLTDDVIANLVRWHLVETSFDAPTGYWITAPLRAWIKDLCIKDAESRERFARLQQSMSENAMFSHYILAHVLSLDWLVIPLERLRSLILKLLPDSLSGLDQAWMKILAFYCASVTYHSQDSRIFLAYGVSLRRCVQWKAAITVFNRLIADAGQRGNFIFQAQILLELSKTYSQQGDYTLALRNISQAEHIIARLQNAPLSTSIALQMAQLAVDMLDGERALSIIASLKKSRRRQFLLSEALLLTGKSGAARKISQRLLNVGLRDRRFQGRTHDLIGRCCLALGKLAGAERHFLSAVSYLETERDRFALARALSNLGAVYVTQKRLHDALHVLRNAEQIQRIIGDKRGLGFTRHNLTAVRQSGLFS